MSFSKLAKKRVADSDPGVPFRSRSGSLKKVESGFQKRLEPDPVFFLEGRIRINSTRL